MFTETQVFNDKSASYSGIKLHFMKTEYSKHADMNIQAHETTTDLTKTVNNMARHKALENVALVLTEKETIYRETLEIIPETLIVCVTSPNVP